MNSVMRAAVVLIAVGAFASALVVASPVVFALQPAPDADCAHEDGCVAVRHFMLGRPGHWDVSCVKSGVRCVEGRCLTGTTISGPGPGAFWCECEPSTRDPHAACHGHFDSAGAGPNMVLICQDPCRVAGAACVPQPNSGGGRCCKCTPQ